MTKLTQKEVRKLLKEGRTKKKPLGKNNQKIESGLFKSGMESMVKLRKLRRDNE